MAKKREGSGSNLGLIITLVFFVLSTVILGVTTYMGFSEQEKLVKDKQAAEKTAALEKTSRDYYRTQARIYRFAIGMDVPVTAQDATELAQQYQQLKDGTLASATGEKDRDEVIKLVKELDQRISWAPNTAAPSSSWVKITADQDNKIQTLQNAVARARADLAKAEQDKKELADEKDKQNEANQKALKELRTVLEADLKKDFYNKAKEEVRKELEAEAKLYASIRQQHAKEKGDREKLEKDLAKLQKKYDTDSRDLRETRRLLDESKNMLTAMAEKHGEDVRALKDSTRDQIAARKLKEWDKDWQVVQMDRSGKLPYINLGSADGLVPQVSFSVHAPARAGGKKLQEVPKATLEVVRVIGPHLSQARLTSIREEKRDPVLKGDMLFNASWDPSRRKQVAVAGIVDLGTDGVDNTEELRRLLARQRVDLVAWVDSKDEKEPTIKTMGEGISKDTEYMILADKMRSSKHPKARSEFATKYDAKRDELIEKAKAAGVTVISISKYLEMIGYRAPKLNATQGGY